MSVEVVHIYFKYVVESVISSSCTEPSTVFHDGDAFLRDRRVGGA